VIALYYAEPVFAGRVLDRDLFAVRVRVRIRSCAAAVGSDRLALPETVVGRERVLETAVLLQRLFVHQYHWQLSVSAAAAAAARLMAAKIVGRTVFLAVAGGQGRRRESADQQQTRRLHLRRRAALQHLRDVNEHLFRVRVQIF